MKIIPEQISQLRQERLKLTSSLAGYADYLGAKEKTSTDKSPCGLIGDSVIDAQFQRDLESKDTVMNLLTKSEYVKVRPTDEVGIGSKCTIRFKADNETSTVFLTEFIYGLSLKQGFVSIASPIGKAVIGKKEGEDFKAAIIDPKTSRVTRYVEGIIEEIKKDPKEYVHFIRERDTKYRMCDAASRKIKELLSDSSEEAREEYESLQTITPSQHYLLMIELERLNRMISTPQTTSRIAHIKKLLKTTKITLPPTDGTIGIGSTFDIVITDGEKSETRHYEMINRAVSEEIEDAYVERIDTLGSKLYGLKENDSIRYRKDGKTYQVSVINVEVPEIKKEASSSYQYTKK